MSKTWKKELPPAVRNLRSERTDKTPQAAIDRLRMEEAHDDIREALTTSAGATNAR
jgi:hypothetical protein